MARSGVLEFPRSIRPLNFPCRISMTELGILWFFSTAFLLLRRYRSTARAEAFPAYGYAGAALMIAGEFLLIAGVEPVAIYFTAIEWTGYVLWADAAVFALRGRSLLRTFPAEFACTAILSIPLWLVFEVYNLRLENWIYIGLPRNTLARMTGYAWSFATIWPGIFETASLLRALGLARGRTDSALQQAPAAEPAMPKRFGAAAIASIAFGLILLIVPVLMPFGTRQYLFGAIWLGFIFLLEPINRRMRGESLWRDLEHKDTSRPFALLGAGVVCGIFWEFWNYWAHARWVYVFPIFQEWKIFAMPLPGYLGFPAFALECFTMLAFAARILNLALQALHSRWRFSEEALRL